MSAYLCFSDYSFNCVQPGRNLQSQLSGFFYAWFFTASNFLSIAASNIPPYLHPTDATDALAHSTCFLAAEFPNDENESRDSPRVRDKGKKHSSIIVFFSLSLSAHTAHVLSFDLDDSFADDTDRDSKSDDGDVDDVDGN